MAQVLIALIDKFDGWYLMILLPVLVVVFIWVISHMKRDKQGKLYWYKSDYQEKKTHNKLDALLKKVDSIDTDQKIMQKVFDGAVDNILNLKKDVLRLQLYCTEASPEERIMAGLRYIKSGGNGITQKYFADYIKQYPDIYKQLSLSNKYVEHTNKENEFVSKLGVAV
jgi:hypothetical protein